MSKQIIYLGLFIGSTAGSYIPVLFGGDLFSLSSILWSGIGGMVGIYAGYRFSQRF